MDEFNINESFTLEEVALLKRHLVRMGSMTDINDDEGFDRYISIRTKVSLLGIEAELRNNLEIAREFDGGDEDALPEGLKAAWRNFHAAMLGGTESEVRHAAAEVEQAEEAYGKGTEAC